jgi:hypothetical protein
MKIVLLACALLIVVSTGVDAVLPARPYVGLYADGARGSMSMTPATFTPFQLWIWWLPSEHGLMATEYRVRIPSNVVVTAYVKNPELQVLLGCPPPGRSRASTDRALRAVVGQRTVSAERIRRISSATPSANDLGA